MKIIPYLSICLATLVFVMGTAQTAQSAEKKIKVFLLAGQSNMEGRGDGSKLTAADKSRLANAAKQIQFAYNQQEIVPLRITTPKAYIARKFKLELTFGPELFSGMGLAEAYPDHKILFIKRSQGGTSLYGCWNPNWTEAKAAVMSEEKKPKLYSSLTSYIKEVLADYDKDDYEFCGMLWVQGEADSGVTKYGPKPAETYGQNLKNLIQGIRKDTGVKDLPFLMLEVGSGKVVEGMQHAATTMDNVSFIPQSKDPQSPAYLPGYGPLTGHYNYEGMKRIGTQFAEVFVKEYGGK